MAETELSEKRIPGHYGSHTPMVSEGSLREIGYDSTDGYRPAF